MSDERLVLHEIDGHVATLTLNRPKALNALSPELIDELIAALAACDADDQIRVILLTGGPRVFAAGGAGGVALTAWALRRAGMPAHRCVSCTRFAGG